MGGPFAGRLTAAARDADRIDLFAFDRAGVLQHRWWDGRHWVAWEAVVGAPTGTSVTCAWVGARLDLFVVGGGGDLHYRRLG